MKKIGGNITASIQVKTVNGKNAIGESLKSWSTVYSPIGFLDLANGDSKYTNYNAKIQESTHLFLCDYFEMSGVDIANSRMIIGSNVYDIMLIDDPMGMHEHYEFYLAFTGVI